MAPLVIGCQVLGQAAGEGFEIDCIAFAGQLPGHALSGRGQVQEAVVELEIGSTHTHMGSVGSRGP